MPYIKRVTRRSSCSYRENPACSRVTRERLRQTIRKQAHPSRKISNRTVNDVAGITYGPSAFPTSDVIPQMGEPRTRL